MEHHHSSDEFFLFYDYFGDSLLILGMCGTADYSIFAAGWVADGKDVLGLAVLGHPHSQRMLCSSETV